MKTKMLNKVLGCVIIIIANLNCYAQDIDSEDRTLSPYFFIQSDHPATDLLPLKSTSAEVNIAGVIADVKVTQVYKNSGLSVLEAIYVFPASTRAAVNGMKMTIGDRTIIAKIEKKELARAQYENAKHSGVSASLLEQQRPNVFQMNVANILPGDEILVELSYSELLLPDAGVYSFVYPTVVGPRYSNLTESIVSNNDGWVSNPYTREGEPPFYTFDLHVSLNAGLPISDVNCNSHDVNISFTGKEQATISLKDADKFAGNKDFILNYKLKGNQIQSGLLLYEGKDENFFLAMIQPPKIIKPEMMPPREYVFIVDVSGSMMGFPLDVSKTLLQNLIGNLKSNDKFNVILFAGGSELMSEVSMNASSANIQKAIEFINNQHGGGGTELLPALKRALALTGTENYSRTFIISTDGYVTIEKEAFDLIRNNLGNANFFTFGIGTAVNRYLIEGMAHAGKGLPFIATSNSEAVKMAEKFQLYVGNPVLTNIQLFFHGFDVYDVEPMEIPDIFSERPVLVFGKYLGKPTGNIELVGENGGLGINQRLDLANYQPDSKNCGIRTLWAREKIKILDDYASIGQGDLYQNEVTILGLRYNLLTNYTSFIAIDSEIRNNGGELVTIHQALPLPEGVSNNAIGTAAQMGGVTLQKSGSFSQCLTETVEEDFSDFEYEIEPLYQESEFIPQFSGGEDELFRFLKKNLTIPEEARRKQINGTVLVEVIIDIDGGICKIHIVQSIDVLLDQEALRIIRLTDGKWKPAEQNGRKVKASVIIPVDFKM
jgi:Ca-activated chloride channel homolog